MLVFEVLLITHLKILRGKSENIWGLEILSPSSSEINNEGKLPPYFCNHSVQTSYKYTF